MVDEKRKKKTDGTVHTVSDVINGLVSALLESGYSMEFDRLVPKYHIDIGLIIKIPSKEIPDFPIGTNWLQEMSGYNWFVNAIEPKAGSFDVMFLLEEEI
jgi:hypothetical protein